MTKVNPHPCHLNSTLTCRPKIKLATGVHHGILLVFFPQDVKSEVPVGIFLYLISYVIKYDTRLYFELKEVNLFPEKTCYSNEIVFFSQFYHLYQSPAISLLATTPTFSEILIMGILVQNILSLVILVSIVSRLKMNNSR